MVKSKLIGGMFEDYKDYLNSWLWKEKRDVILEQYKVCEKCGVKKSVLVHHLTYENVCNEKKRELLALCWDCHTKIHEMIDDVNTKTVDGKQI